MSELITTKKLHAFVLMPFSAEFDEVYKHIICESLSTIGYETTRADNPKNARNIMHDVIQGIIDSDLIIADITGANPNVYYELGISHAMSKKVVLLTQDIDDVPFDLRAYRVITYSTHFARVEEAKAQLLETARHSQNANFKFSNPVTDYISTEKIQLNNEQQSNVTNNVIREELGILDFAIGFEDGINVMAEVMNEVGIGMNRLVPLIEQTTKELTQKPNLTAHNQRIVIRTLASEVNDFATSLKQGNSRYREGLSDVTESLDAFFSADLNKIPEAQEGVVALQATIAESEINAIGCRDAMNGLLNILGSLPSIEKEFNRSKQRLSEEIKSLVDNIDLTISSLSRAKSATNQSLV